MKNRTNLKRLRQGGSKYTNKKIQLLAELVVLSNSIWLERMIPQEWVKPMYPEGRMHAEKAGKVEME